MVDFLRVKIAVAVDCIEHRAVARKSAMVVKHEKFEKKLDISHYFGTFSLLWKH
jgi:hypothetical protein